MKKYIVVALSALMIMLCVPSASVYATDGVTYTHYVDGYVDGVGDFSQVITNEYEHYISSVYFYENGDVSFEIAFFNGEPYRFSAVSWGSHMNGHLYSFSYNYYYRVLKKGDYIEEGFHTPVSNYGAAMTFCNLSRSECANVNENKTHSYFVSSDLYSIKYYNSDYVWYNPHLKNREYKMVYRGLNTAGKYIVAFSDCEKLAWTIFPSGDDRYMQIFGRSGALDVYITDNSDNTGHISKQTVYTLSDDIVSYDCVLLKKDYETSFEDTYSNPYPDYYASSDLVYFSNQYDIIPYLMTGDEVHTQPVPTSTPTPTPKPTSTPTGSPDSLTPLPSSAPTQAPQVIIVQPDKTIGLDVPDVMDAVGAAQDGFGLLGNNGFLAMLREATAFIIPDAFWDLILWALGIGLAVALVKLIF